MEVHGQYTGNRNAQPGGSCITIAAVKTCGTALRVSNLLALREEVRDLGRKHQRAAVVALDKLNNDFSGLLRLVLLEEVASGRED